MKHITVKKRCTKCLEGEMVATGMVLTSYPASYGHRCENCGIREHYKSSYPYEYDEYEPRELEERFE